MSIPLKKANILLPKDSDMEKWAVIACDQYTSEPEYWKKVEEIVGHNPSTLKTTLPEIYLEEEGVEERISNINIETVNLDDIYNRLDQLSNKTNETKEEIVEPVNEISKVLKLNGVNKVFVATFLTRADTFYVKG